MFRLVTPWLLEKWFYVLMAASIVCSVVSGCTQTPNESTYGKSAQERLQRTIESIKEDLAGAPLGSLAYWRYSRELEVLDSVTLTDLAVPRLAYAVSLSSPRDADRRMLIVRWFELEARVTAVRVSDAQSRSYDIPLLDACLEGNVEDAQKGYHLYQYSVHHFGSDTDLGKLIASADSGIQLLENERAVSPRHSIVRAEELEDASGRKDAGTSIN